MKPVDRWGPFAPGIDATERTARLRALRAIVHCRCGQRGNRLVWLLIQAERDESVTESVVAESVVAESNALASLDQRRALASFGEAGLGR